MHKVYVSREDYFDLSDATRIPPSARHTERRSWLTMSHAILYRDRHTVFKIGRLSVRRGVCI
jgi:hypothetical protein